MSQAPGPTALRRVLLVLAVVLVTGLLAELGSAATAEYRLSLQLRAAAHLNTDPEVTVGGFPYLLSDGTHPKLSIAVPAQVGTPGDTRKARIETELHQVRLPDAVLPTFTPDTVITAGHIESRIRLDQKTFGRYLDIVDLQVHTPAPKRPGAGSPADGYVKSAKGIVLTGEIPLPTAADPRRRVLVSVAADFSAVGKAIHVQATGIYTGPEDHAQADLLPGDEPRVLAAFTRTLPEMALPFGVRATGARGENADVVLLGEADAVTVTPGGFYRPVA